MKNRYAEILKNDSELYKAAVSLEKEYTEKFDKLTAEIFAPCVVMYTAAVIEEARRRDIKRLYFLARDGYLMYKAALKLCEKTDTDIECSYFYCSRYSLRMAAYRFRDDSAYDRLFIYSYKLSARNILGRAGFDEIERKKVYDDIGFDMSREEDIMEKSAFDGLCARLKSSAVFDSILMARSDAAYENIVKYIDQEKMGQHDKIGVVDLGWTGSLQYTLRRLLDSMDIKTKITGFYVGMLERPKSREGSEYVTWLFDEKEKRTKAWFAHNLLECLFSAPHGMTVGYEKKGSEIVPVLEKDENDGLFVRQIEKISLKIIKKYDIGHEECHRKTALSLLKKIMFSPDRDEAEALCGYRFCDDIGEQYHGVIAHKATGKELRTELLFHKLFHRGSADGFYWYCGSAALSGVTFKRLYRYSFFLTKLTISFLR